MYVSQANNFCDFIASELKFIAQVLIVLLQSKFYKIQRENQHLGPWLSDVQRTVENLFAVRRKCDTLAKSRQR